MAFGAALHWDVPALRGFNFRGGMVLIPELAALTLALSVYTSAFIAEIIRAGIGQCLMVNMKRHGHWDYPTRLRYAVSLFPVHCE